MLYFVNLLSRCFICLFSTSAYIIYSSSFCHSVLQHTVLVKNTSVFLLTVHSLCSVCPFSVITLEVSDRQLSFHGSQFPCLPLNWAQFQFQSSGFTCVQISDIKAALVLTGRIGAGVDRVTGSDGLMLW